MKKWLAFVLSYIILALLHEGGHLVFALLFNEYQALQFNMPLLGPEVTYRTPVDERVGVHWAVIAGASSILTLSLGYLLLLLAKRVARVQARFPRAVLYYLTFLALLVDAFNLSIGASIYGGDAEGIAVGLAVPRYWVQIVFVLVLFINRELIAQKLLPIYGVRTNHFLLRPWLYRVKPA